MFVWLRHFIGWVVSALGSRGDLILENLALRQQLLALHAKRPRHRSSTTHKLFWVFLRRLWSRMENASCSGHATNCGGVASGWFSPVLEMALPSQASRRPKAGEQGNSGADFSHGCREPNVGSTPYSRRAAEAGLPSVRAAGITLPATSAASARSSPALADVPAEPS